MSGNLIVFTILIAALVAIVIYNFIGRKKPTDTEPPAPEPPLPPDDTCVSLVGIDVFVPPQMIGATPWFDPSDPKWPAMSFPAGSVLCFAPVIQMACGRTVPTRYEFIAYDVTRQRIAWRGELAHGQEPGYATWNGEMFIAGGCGDFAPKPYRIVCLMRDSSGGMQQAEITIHAVGEHACRR